MSQPVYAWPADRLDHAHAVAAALTAQHAAGRHPIGDAPRTFKAKLTGSKATLYASAPMWPEQDRPQTPRTHAPEHPNLTALLRRVRGQG